LIGTRGCALELERLHMSPDNEALRVQEFVRRKKQVQLEKRNKFEAQNVSFSLLIVAFIK
jgi:hypothetical protein